MCQSSFGDHLSEAGGIQRAGRSRIYEVYKAPGLVSDSFVDVMLVSVYMLRTLRYY